MRVVRVYAVRQALSTYMWCVCMLCVNRHAMAPDAVDADAVADADTAAEADANAPAADGSPQGPSGATSTCISAAPACLLADAEANPDA